MSKEVEVPKECIVHSWVNVVEWHRICKVCGIMEIYSPFFFYWVRTNNFDKFLKSVNYQRDEEHVKNASRVEALKYLQAMQKEGECQ